MNDSPLRVLLVEDDPAFGAALARGLREADLKLTGPVLVPVALELISAQTFDGAVVDLRVAGRSGIRTVNTVRRPSRPRAHPRRHARAVPARASLAA